MLTADYVLDEPLEALAEWMPSHPHVPGSPARDPAEILARWKSSCLSQSEESRLPRPLYTRRVEPAPEVGFIPEWDPEVVEEPPEPAPALAAPAPAPTFQLGDIHLNPSYGRVRFTTSQRQRINCSRESSLFRATVYCDPSF
jgi:hypothetical protein